MVRRGSTVRVRQRALQNPRSRGFFVQDDLLFVVRAVGMEPLYGAFAHGSRLRPRLRGGRMATTADECAAPAHRACVSFSWSNVAGMTFALPRKRRRAGAQIAIHL